MRLGVHGFGAMGFILDSFRIRPVSEFDSLQVGRMGEADWSPWKQI